MKKYNEDFTTITSEVYDKIRKATEKLGCMPVMVCRASNHPEDDYLWVVLGQYTKPTPFGEYCVWTANVSRPTESADLFYGHYGVSFKVALDVVADKVRDLNKEEEAM
jgi:hypothetical protein